MEEIEIEVGSLSPAKMVDTTTTPTFRPLASKAGSEEAAKARHDPVVSSSKARLEEKFSKGRVDNVRSKGGGKPGDILSPSKLPPPTSAPGLHIIPTFQVLISCSTRSNLRRFKQNVFPFRGPFHYKRKLDIESYKSENINNSSTCF